MTDAGMSEAEVLEQLQAKEAELVAQMEQLTRPQQEQGAISFGKRVGDGTAMAIDRFNAVNTHDQLSELLERVRRAKTKLEEGTYGLCDTCGQEIAPGRLEVRSWSTTCMQHS